jgi:hypothetical protein
MRKLIIAFVVALIMVMGCAATPRDIPGPVASESAYADDQSYPQMQTNEMIARQADAEAMFNVTFLGAYTDTHDAWIFWVRDHNNNDVCETIVMLPGMAPASFTCGEGFEMYLEACASVGNCT